MEKVLGIAATVSTILMGVYAAIEISKNFKKTTA